jgi:hypothetical protein
MKFRDERRRFFDNLLIRFLLHFAVSLLGIASIFYALRESSWVPIIGFIIFVTIFEGFFLFDLIYGWPKKRE